MAFSRSLLIKGIAGGLGACAACAGGVGIYKSVSSSEKLTDKQLIEEAGLDCGLGDNENEVAGTKDCSVKTDGGKINVKKGDQTEEEVSFTNEGTTKLKVSKSEEGGYSKNLKFVVDSGDITLTRDRSGSSSSITTKLGQYETYEIKKEDGKYYLFLKDSVEKAKTKILVLPESCTLPADEGNTTSCTLSAEEIKKVKFDGKTDGSITLSGNTSLTIIKTKDTTTFSEGYKLTFTFPSDVTISSDNSVKGSIPTDFKIKKAASGNGLTLEKAWSDDNEFIKKVGLNCGGNNNECTLTTPDGKLNVKVGDKKREGITSLGDGGKIKLEKDQPGYNQGLKFTITTADITLNNGGQGDISKLEEFETYEITEAGGKYYLTRKTGKEDIIKTSLGLPCNLPAQDSIDCVVPADQAKGVKFDGQATDKPQVELRLKIEKTDDTTTYPHGYKFTLISDKDIALSDTSTIKKNTNTVFKIKKADSGNTLSLEKAWEDNKLAEKVGLNCSSSENECTIASSGTIKTLSVKIGDDKKENITSINGGGKIKLEKDQADYNQGFKFTISDNDVTLTITGADASDNKLEELETYEITEDAGKYYLTRKTTKEEAIKKSLSIPDDCFTSKPNACSTLTTSKLSAINFDGKNGGTVVSVNGNNSKVSLTVSKVTNSTDFPLGYRFTFLTTGEMSITETNKVKANIPTDFKIKKNGNGNTLSLVKAWSKDSDLIAKVGLDGDGCSEGTGECTIKTTNTPGLNVKQGETVHEGKSKSDSSQGKIKLYKDKKGYLEGLKFVIEDGDITLDNTGGSSSIKLTQFETYGIEEKDGKYYLSKKTDGKDEKIKKLGLPEDCKWEESSSSTSSRQICSISQEQLKSVKFKNKKSDSQITTTNDGSITVMFNEIKELKDGEDIKILKVSFISKSETEVKIPLDGADNGAIVLRKNMGKEFKITKGDDGTLSLEKAFDINEFVKEAGLEKCYDDLGCSLKEKINVWLETGRYSVKAKVDEGSKVHKVSYEEVISGGYNKGIKFTLQNPITIQNGDASSGAINEGSVTSLNKGDEFHVMQHEINSTNYWFLSKVSS